MALAESPDWWESVTLEGKQIHGRAQFTLTYRCKGQKVALQIPLYSLDLGRPMLASAELLVKGMVADHVEELIRHTVEPF